MITKVSVFKGDITRADTDAIVNAANTSLLGGGGVDGAIHDAAGPGLLEECRQLGGCETGNAKLTKGYNLRAKYVIHTPGPIYRQGSEKQSKELLAKCYKSCLALAQANGIRSIAFPCISTGIFGFPKDAAAEIAIKVVFRFCKRNQVVLDEVIFVTYSHEDYELYCFMLKAIKMIRDYC